MEKVTIWKTQLAEFFFVEFIKLKTGKKLNLKKTKTNLKTEFKKCKIFLDDFKLKNCKKK